jgi:hypothetical protein
MFYPSDLDTRAVLNVTQPMVLLARRRALITFEEVNGGQIVEGQVTVRAHFGTLEVSALSGDHSMGRDPVPVVDAREQALPGRYGTQSPWRSRSGP